jgi:hypothetical protein
MRSYNPTTQGHKGRNGFEHHVAMNHSASAEILHEAFTRYLNVSTYLHR